MTVTDRNGINIEVGFYVKVISLDTADFGHLEKTSLSEVMSMIGEVLEVYEVDEYGQAWVTKEWWLSGDEMIAHSVGLSSHEMEVQTGCS